MAGRRRTGAGLKAFADTVEGFAKSNYDNYLKRKNLDYEYDLKRKKETDDFTRRLSEAGILTDKIASGELDPYTASYAMGGKPSLYGKRKTSTDIEADLVERLGSDDPVVRERAASDLERWKQVRPTFRSQKSGRGERTETLQEKADREREAIDEARKREIGDIPYFFERRFGRGGAEAAPVTQGTGLVPQTGLTSATSFGSPSSRQVGVQPIQPTSPRPQPNPELVKQVLIEAEDALRRGADPAAVRKRVEEILGF